DAPGAHGPGYKGPPELSPAEALANPFWGGDRSFTFRRLEVLRAIMEHSGDADKHVWVTEFGWTSDPQNRGYEWARVSEEVKGDYLVRALYWARLHWAPWVGPMFVWTMPDRTWGPGDEKYWWAIADPDGTPRPAYQALRAARRRSCGGGRWGRCCAAWGCWARTAAPCRRISAPGAGRCGVRGARRRCCAAAAGRAARSAGRW